jgi:hypothetical protein
MNSGMPRTTTDGPQSRHEAGRPADVRELRLTGHGVVLREWTDEDLSFTLLTWVHEDPGARPA